jgi:hypothetical protein
MQDHIGDGALRDEGGDTFAAVEGRILEQCRSGCCDKCPSTGEGGFEGKARGWERFVENVANVAGSVRGQPQEDRGADRILWQVPLPGNPEVNRIGEAEIAKARLQSQHQIGMSPDQISWQAAGPNAGFAVLQPRQEQPEIEPRQIGQGRMLLTDILAGQEGRKCARVSCFRSPFTTIDLPQFREAPGTDNAGNLPEYNYGFNGTRRRSQATGVTPDRGNDRCHVAIGLALMDARAKLQGARQFRYLGEREEKGGEDA